MRSIKQEVRNPLGIRPHEQGSVDTRIRVGQDTERLTFAVERGLLKAMLRALGNPPVSIETWDGWVLKAETHATLARPVRCKLHLRDPGALIRLVLDPEYQFGELYCSGRIELEGNLVELVESIFIAQRDRYNGFSRLLRHLHAPRSNLLGQAKENIHHHYDIGDDFYRLWLDSELVYTCAYFPETSVTLEQAQRAKMEMICRKLRLRPGERVVEAGCGWGALSLYMAREYGVKVHAYNISPRQIAYARQRARDEGLQDQVSFIEADYRAIRGEYDVFVSVGMLEHVGRNHYPMLGKTIAGCLGKKGRGFLHSIGSDRSMPLNAWIERRIFPGAYPPTMREMMSVIEAANMSVQDVENLRLHYAKTLEHWLHRFESAATRIESMFDPLFVRAWQLYLSGSLAAFRSGKLQLFQVLFQRNGENDIAWTRAALYEDQMCSRSRSCNDSTS